MTSRPSSSSAPARLAAALLADLGDWGVHLGTRSFTRVAVEMLLRDLRRMVPSALGYTLVVVETPELPRVSITVADGPPTPGQVGSSLGFDLPVARGACAVATFFAHEEGAFDRLADLLGVGLGAGGVRLAGASAEVLTPGVDGLADHSTVNYAIGILLQRGLSVDESRRYLDGLAGRLGTLHGAADHVLAGLRA
jgi:hypothetical protein